MSARYGAILITGATSGVGEAFAAAAPADSALALTGRDADRLADLSARYSKPGRRVETIAADLATDAGRNAIIDWATAFAPDLIVNNAGFGRFGPALGNAVEDETGMIATNALAPVEITRRLAPAMIDRADAAGRRCGLIFVSSVVAYAPLPMLATYSATKAFLSRYAEALGAELTDRAIDVLALCPGATKTRFHARAGVGFSGPMDSAERVAAEGYAMLGRKTVHVVNPRNRFAAVAMGATPRKLFMRAAGAAMRRRAP